MCTTHDQLSRNIQQIQLFICIILTVFLLLVWDKLHWVLIQYKYTERIVMCNGYKKCYSPISCFMGYSSSNLYSTYLCKNVQFKSCQTLPPITKLTNRNTQYCTRKTIFLYLVQKYFDHKMQFYLNMNLRIMLNDISCS